MQNSEDDWDETRYEITMDSTDCFFIFISTVREEFKGVQYGPTVLSFSLETEMVSIPALADFLRMACPQITADDLKIQIISSHNTF